MFGNPETTTGGRALKFYASVRMEIRRAGSINEGDQAVGNKVRVKVVKNKLTSPFKQADFDIMYGSGISAEGDVVDLGANLGIIKKTGTWYSYGDDRLGQGREYAKKFLKDNNDIFLKIEKEIRDKILSEKTVK